MKPNINATFKISINSGTALLLWILCFFGLLWMTQHHPAIQDEFTIAVAALTTAFGGYLVKRNSNNKIELQAQRIVGVQGGKTDTYHTIISGRSDPGDITDTAGGQPKD